MRRGRETEAFVRSFALLRSLSRLVGEKEGREGDGELLVVDVERGAAYNKFSSLDARICSCRHYFGGAGFGVRGSTVVLASSSLTNRLIKVASLDFGTRISSRACLRVRRTPSNYRCAEGWSQTRATQEGGREGEAGAIIMM